MTQNLVKTAESIEVGQTVTVETTTGQAFNGTVVEEQRPSTNHHRKLVDGTPQFVIEVYYSQNSVLVSFEDETSLEVDTIPLID